MKRRIKLFEYFSNNNLEKSPFLLAARKGVYLFSMASYDSLETFLTQNDWLYKELKWPLNPSLTTNAEQVFNLYLERFPIFCLIIDTNNDEVYGSSLNNECELGVFVDKYTRPGDESKFYEYLDKLGSTIDHLI